MQEAKSHTLALRIDKMKEGDKDRETELCNSASWMTSISVYILELIC